VGCLLSHGASICEKDKFGRNFLVAYISEMMFRYEYSRKRTFLKSKVPILWSKLDFKQTNEMFSL